MPEAHANLASAYKDSGLVDQAIVSYQQALLLRPDFPEATCNMLHTLQFVCDWNNREKMFAEVEGIIKKQIKMSVLPSVQLFHAIAYPIDPILALEISCSYDTDSLWAVFLITGSVSTSILVLFKARFLPNYSIRSMRNVSLPVRDVCVNVWKFKLRLKRRSQISRRCSSLLPHVTPVLSMHCHCLSSISCLYTIPYGLDAGI